jgi:hypothetical protein
MKGDIMKIKMNQRVRISEDSWTTRVLESGETYEFPDCSSAARQVLCRNQGVEVIEPVNELLDCFKSNDINEQLAALEKLV